MYTEIIALITGIIVTTILYVLNVKNKVTLGIVLISIMFITNIILTFYTIKSLKTEWNIQSQDTLKLNLQITNDTIKSNNNTFLIKSDTLKYYFKSNKRNYISCCLKNNTDTLLFSSDKSSHLNFYKLTLDTTYNVPVLIVKDKEYVKNKWIRNYMLPRLQRIIEIRCNKKDYNDAINQFKKSRLNS